MCFGKGTNPLHNANIDGASIPWVPHWKYLGVTLQSGDSFECCIKNKLASFYRSLNSIIRIEGGADEMVKLRLLEAHCLPILTYGIEVIYVRNRNVRRQLRVAYDSIFRNIFRYTYNESVTNLQHSLSRKTWEELLDIRQIKLRQNCALCTESSLVRILSTLSL